MKRNRLVKPVQDVVNDEASQEFLPDYLGLIVSVILTVQGLLVSATWQKAVYEVESPRSEDAASAVLTFGYFSLLPDSLNR